MSTLKMQESTPDDEVTRLRKQASNKDVRYATLENELFKRNNEFLALKSTLDDTLYKLHNEADRAVKLEADLIRRSEDLRAERVTCQNLEKSLDAANGKLKSGEIASRYLESELETCASRTASQHQAEMKQLRHEKMMLEARVRTLEIQSQGNKQPLLPTRLPRSTTLTGTATAPSDEGIFALQSELSETKQELLVVSEALSNARQEAAKSSRLQTKLIAAENAQLRAERLLSVEKARADNAQETLSERDEELKYWRDIAEQQSSAEAKVEILTMEREDALKRENDIRSREEVLRKRLERMEEKEVELVMEREQALDALHQLQTESDPTASAKAPESDSTVEDLRTALADREAALLKTRGYASELQHMYHDTLSACEAAEARVHDLERQHTNKKEHGPPLIIVSPPPSPSPSAPFLAAPGPRKKSAVDEAVVERLLIAIERLRSERDALRRSLNFAQIEQRVTVDTLQEKLDAIQNAVHRSTMDSQVKQDEIHASSNVEMRRLKDELQHWQQRFSEMDNALTKRTTDLEICNTEMEDLRAQVRALRDELERASTSRAKVAKVVLVSFMVIERLRSNFEELEGSNKMLSQKCEDLAALCGLLEARGHANISSPEAIDAKDTSLCAQDSLGGEFATTDLHLSEALQVSQDHEGLVAIMQTQLFELQSAYSSLEQELADTRAELNSVETRYSEHQLSALASADVEAADALKAQLEVLEQRVLRRTEQIGMQQHDIKRLETNLRVAEDTIGELNLEVETLGREKECLVEDCAQAREARDDAHRRLEHLEVEFEALPKDHEKLAELKSALGDAEAELVAGERRIETLVHVIADISAKSRALSVDLALTTTRLTTTEGTLRAVEASNTEAHTEVQRLASELESKILMFNEKVTEVNTIGRELSLAREETQRVLSAFEAFKQDVQSREEDISGKANRLVETVQELEGCLTASRASEEVLSRELKSAEQAEIALKEQLIKAREEYRDTAAKAERLSSTVASLQESHSKDMEQAQHKFDTLLLKFEAQPEEYRTQRVSLETKHAQAIKDLVAKNEGLQARLADVNQVATSREALETELRCLKDEHAEELLVFRSRLDESVGQIEALQAQLTAATDTINDLESEMRASARRYEETQVEIRGLEHALSGARVQLDEHDTSLQALRREKTLLQSEHTRLEAELEKSVTKYQYLEQHARRSNQEIMRLKEEVDRLHAEAAKFDEAAQKAEVSLSFKTVQYEQKLAMMQRELKKQEEHHHCQDSIAELSEKNEYLEEMLRMKSIEIEENDDRFIEALKEKKRLSGKIESMTRKVQNLQAKLAAFTVQPSPTPPVALQKTPSPPLPSLPSAGPSVRSSTRIPSSPAMALRAKTPEPSRSQFLSRIATPEPPVPVLLQAFKTKAPEHQTSARTTQRMDRARVTDVDVAPTRVTPLEMQTTPPLGSRKRRAPDDFDAPAPMPTEVIIAPSLTPRHLRRPTNEGRSGFTPTRNGAVIPARSSLAQPSPLRRVTAPLLETTNSPRGARVLGLGQPTAAKPPMRSWLNRNRPPAGRGIDTRISASSVRP